MNILSCFDGMSCLQIALERMGRKVDKYFASEIDKYAIAATKHQYPNTIHIGDVTKVSAKDLPRLDLVAGGSPCQGFSFAGKGLNFEDPRSKLFFEFVRLVSEAREINPDVKFLLENVMMEKWCQDIISKMLGVNPIRINSALVSAQNRDRLYWTNIGLAQAGLFGDMASIIQQPKDKGLVLSDILEEEVDEKYYLSDTALARIGGASKTDRGIRYHRGDERKSGISEIGFVSGGENKSDAILSSHSPKVYQIGVLNNNGVLVESNEKANCIDANFHKGMDNHSQRTMIKTIVHHGLPRTGGHKQGGTGPLKRDDGKTYCLDTSSRTNNVEVIADDIKFRIRRLTPIECCRLQTVPDDYFEDSGVSESQQYKMLGNGWTIDVITHILSYWK